MRITNGKIWKDDQRYLVVSDFDLEKFTHLISRAAGADSPKKIKQYLRKCCANSANEYNDMLTYERRLSGETKLQLPLRLLRPLEEFSEGRITLDQLLAANGLIKLSEAEYILDSLKPIATHEKKDLRLKKWRDLIESRTEATDYFSFCENLELFCCKLKRKNVKYLLQNKLKLFSSPFLVSCLSEYGNIIREKKERLHYGEIPENEEKEKDLWFVLNNFLVENPGWLERRFSED